MYNPITPKMRKGVHRCINKEYLEPTILCTDAIRVKKHCLTCVRTDFAIVRWTVILCMKRLLPNVRDLHRLIAGTKYLPFPWLETVFWDWKFWHSMKEHNQWFSRYSSTAECLVIQFIDRGVADFGLFAKMLKEQFPRLKRLQWNQNFSYQQTFANLVMFIKEMQLEKLWISDRQSEMFDDCEWLSIPVPKGAVYTFVCGFNKKTITLRGI
jgi:hypothetical protein